MDGLGLHFVPLLFIPGVALLVLSTSNRLTNLTNRVLNEGKDVPAIYTKRVQLFRKALVSFYICISFFTLATLINSLAISSESILYMVRIVMLIGSIFLYFGISCMVFESWISMKNS